MAYIGKSIESGTFSVLDTSGNTYNGSNTTFSLGTQVGSPAQLLVSHDGVIQKPGTDYSLASGGTQITFSTAPASGASIFIVEISGAVGGPLDSDLNGSELILDADGDTSITADTDDQIDVKIAGADDFKFSANAMNVLSGSTLTIDSGATITNSGTANGFGTDPDGAQTFNESGASVDFRVETDNQTHALFIDGSADKIGILKSDPAVTLDVTGTIRSSVGILFGSDTAADNTLDDYEQGDATLSFQDSAGNNYTGSYGSVRNFRYQKIGNKVYGQFRVQTNSGGSLTSGMTGSNGIQLTGLPFTSNSASGAHYGIGHAASDSFGANFDSDDRDVFCYVEPGSSIIKFAFTHDNDEPERVLVSEIPVFSPGAYHGYILAGNLTYFV